MASGAPLLRAPVALAVAFVVATAASAATRRVELVVVVNGSDLVAVGGDGVRDRLTTLGGRDPAVSADGGRIAFTSDRGGATRVLVLNVPTGHVEPVGRGREPAWSADGRLAIATADGVVVDGRVVAPGGSQPAFSRDGRLAVTLPDGVHVDGALVVPGGRSPAFAPDGRLAVTAGTQVLVDGAVSVPDAAEPAWSPDGRRLGFVRDGRVWTARADGSDARPLRGSRAGDSAPAWAAVLAIVPPKKPAPPPRADELLPDLDQRAPAGLTVTASGRRFLLGFVSATDNVGRGPMWIRGTRSGRRTAVMRAHQLIRLRTGGPRVVRDVGILRYTWSSSHSHWHVMRFMRYELRRAGDFGLVAADRKTGFCLADHYGFARHRVIGAGPPVFLGNCEAGRPDAIRVEQGSSMGFTDRYPAHFHGQNVDVTRAPAGRYWLVHRSNPSKRLRELRYGNNAAAVLVRLAWPYGRRAAPRVTVLRTCEGAERC